MQGINMGKVLLAKIRRQHAHMGFKGMVPKQECLKPVHQVIVPTAASVMIIAASIVFSSLVCMPAKSVRLWRRCPLHGSRLRNRQPLTPAYPLVKFRGLQIDQGLNVLCSCLACRIYITLCRVDCECLKMSDGYKDAQTGSLRSSCC